jgi:hypothetical protein
MRRAVPRPQLWCVVTTHHTHRTTHSTSHTPLDTSRRTPYVTRHTLVKLIHQIIDADHPVHKGISHNDHSSLLAATPTAESLKEAVDEMIEVRICAHASLLTGEGRPLALFA